MKYLSLLYLLLYKCIFFLVFRGKKKFLTAMKNAEDINKTTNARSRLNCAKHGNYEGLANMETM